MTDLAHDKPRLLSVGRHRQRAWHIPSHRHPFYEMIVIIRGAEGVRTDTQTARAETGEVLLFRPGEGHEEWVEGPEELDTCFIAFDAGVAASPWPSRVWDADGRLRILAAWLHDLRDENLPQAAATRSAFFTALLAEFHRLAHSRETPLVHRVRQFMRHHLGERLQLGDLAREAGLSRFYFVREYRRQTGMTPMEDLRRLRVCQARDLLLTSSLPLKAIAPMVGVEEERSLFRLFRRYLRVSPGEIRRTIPAASRQTATEALPERLLTPGRRDTSRPQR
jgi:AraC-like DNA-binding protein